MAFTILEIGIAIAVVVATTLTWRVINWVWLRPKKFEKHLRKQGFHANSYRFLYGDTKEHISTLMATRSNPIPISHDIVPSRSTPFLCKLVREYGKRTFFWAGPVPKIVIMDPEMVNEVLNKNFRYPKTKAHPLLKRSVQGLPSLDGSKWTTHRRLLNPAFHAEKLKSMLPAFDLCCHEMTIKWMDMIGEGRNSCELDVWPSLQTLTSDVISRTAFGSSYQEGKRVFELQVEQADYVFKAAQSVYLPGLRFLPTKRNQRMKEINEEVQFLLSGIIDKKMKAMKAEDDSTDDLLGLLLEANSKEVEQGNRNEMSIEDVIEECKVFYFAGHETTSVLLVWTLVLLSMYPDWQDRARQEVLQVTKDDKADIGHLNHLKMVTMILYEVLRLYPPVAGLGRQITKDITLADITLLPGMQIVLPINQIHHDHDIWGADAKEFNPERFSEGVSKATNNQVAAFFPFGGGPRICIGQNFALLEAKLAIAMILRKFSFELSPSYKHAPINKITLQPEYGASLILHKL